MSRLLCWRGAAGAERGRDGEGWGGRGREGWGARADGAEELAGGRGEVDHGGDGPSGEALAVQPVKRNPGKDDRRRRVIR